MPIETRKLQFDANEIRAALIHYALRTEMRLPKEGIDKVRFSKDGANVTFIYARSSEGEKREVIFTEQQVGAAILLYCHTRGFPMPRAAEKVVKNEGNSTSLMLRLVHGD